MLYNLNWNLPHCDALSNKLAINAIGQEVEIVGWLGYINGWLGEVFVSWSAVAKKRAKVYCNVVMEQYFC